MHEVEGSSPFETTIMQDFDVLCVEILHFCMNKPFPQIKMATVKGAIKETELKSENGFFFQSGALFVIRKRTR